MVAKLRIEVEFTHDKFERQWINEKRVKTTTISLSMKRKMMRWYFSLFSLESNAKLPGLINAINTIVDASVSPRYSFNFNYCYDIPNDIIDIRLHLSTDHYATTRMNYYVYYHHLYCNFNLNTRDEETPLRIGNNEARS